MCVCVCVCVRERGVWGDGVCGGGRVWGWGVVCVGGWGGGGDGCMCVGGRDRGKVSLPLTDVQVHCS